MMAESMDSRRFERKGVFDIPLPMKRVPRENPPTESSTESATPEPMPTKTMAFSLMTKKGNKQQVRPHCSVKRVIHTNTLIPCRHVLLIFQRILALLLLCAVSDKLIGKNNSVSRTWF
jgi:hypothetical protein